MSNFEDPMNRNVDIRERLNRVEKLLEDIAEILKTADTKYSTWSARIPSSHISDDGEDEPHGI